MKWKDNKDIYDDFKYKKNNFCFHGLYKTISALQGLNKMVFIYSTV